MQVVLAKADHIPSAYPGPKGMGNYAIETLWTISLSWRGRLKNCAAHVRYLRHRPSFLLFFL